MNAKIANLLVDYISTLAWTDKIAGLVQTVKVSQQDGNRKIEKRYPVSCSINVSDPCINGCYEDLIPDSKYASLIYFEDGGLSLQKTYRNRHYYQSNLRLVCWINYLNQRGGGCAATGNYMIDIINSLPSYPVNIDGFYGVFPQISSQVIRSSAIFDKYTYNEKQTQYLMLPYDYFALELRTTFFVINNCLVPAAGCMPC